MSKSICLNADLGELPGEDGRALDTAMLRVVTRCNIACGGHAGDSETMLRTVEAANSHRVRIGAHPSYPDIEHFGRRSLQMAPEALALSLQAQVSSLLKVTQNAGLRVTHLKAHGALYNDAAKDGRLAGLIAGVAADAGIPELVGPPGSTLQAAAQGAGLRFLAEGFADRSYEPGGTLTPRSVPGAVIEDAAAMLAQALLVVRSGVVDVRGGGRIALPVETLCLHSDTPGAAGLAAVLRAGLAAAGVEVRA